MYSLEEISEFVTDNFYNEPEFCFYEIKPTKKFVRDFATKIKELLDYGIVKCIEDAWALVLMFTDHEYWRYIAEEQYREKEKNKKEQIEYLKKICNSNAKGIIEIEEIF